MRTPRFTTWLVLGIAVALAYVVRRGRRAPWRRASPPARDPAAPPAPEPPAPSPPAESYAVPVAPASVDLDQLAGVIDEVGGLHVEVLRPEASSAWDDADAADTAGDAADTEPADLADEAEDPEVYGDPRASLGSGELYDVHVVGAVDRDLPDDDQAQDEGEHWLEHLEASTAELGPVPEHELDVVDDSDLHAGHHKTDRDDTPVADRGSGGPRGL